MLIFNILDLFHNFETQMYMIFFAKYMNWHLFSLYLRIK